MNRPTKPLLLAFALWLLPLFANGWNIGSLSTGQTTSYGNYDDGYYQKGTARSFSRDANGTVTDSVTGLMWRDDSNASTTINNWEDANLTCENMSFGGYDDWRLPTITELSSLSDANNSSSAIFSVFQNTAGFYWSSTPYEPNTTKAWSLGFSNGLVSSNDKVGDLYVRCVRGETPSASSFTKSGNIVTDSTTGLQWQDDQIISGKTWAQAIDYCEALSLDGYTDWRLPNRNELQSIIDYTDATPPLINTTFQYTATMGTYWSSTTFAPNMSDAWSVLFYDGNVNYNSKGSNYYVRCVRGGYEPLALSILNSYPTSTKYRYSYTLPSGYTYWSATSNILGELYLSGRYGTPHYTIKVNSDGSEAWRDDTHGGDSYSVSTDGVYGYSMGWGGPLKKYLNSNTPLSSYTTSGYHIDTDSEGNTYILINGGGVKKVNSALNSVVWTFNAHTDLNISDAISSHVVYRDGFVYIVGVDWATRQQLFIYKLNSATGAKVWRYQTSASANAQDARLAVTDEYVYSAFANQKSIKLKNTDGSLVGEGAYYSNLTTDGRYLYGNSGNIKKLDENLSILEDLGGGKIVSFKESGYVKLETDNVTFKYYDTNSSAIKIPHNEGTKTINLRVFDKDSRSLNISAINSNPSLATINPTWTNPVSSALYQNTPLQLQITPTTSMEATLQLQFTVDSGFANISRYIDVNLYKKHIAIPLNITSVNLSEYNITNIQYIGVDGNNENFPIAGTQNLVNGDNNISILVMNPDNNFSLRFDANTTWYHYNFCDGKLYSESNSSNCFKSTATSTLVVDVNVSSCNWINVLSSGQQIMVTSNQNSGSGSLRDAINSLSAGVPATIDLTPISGQPINLSSPIFVGNKEISIINTGALEVNISGGQTFRAFEFNNSSIFISGVNIVGGGIRAQNSDLNITKSMFVGNRFGGDGAALSLLGGNTTILDSHFVGNEVYTDGNDYANGGAIFMQGGNLSIYTSLFSSNTARTSGGAVFLDSGSLMIESSTVAFNKSDGVDMSSSCYNETNESGCASNSECVWNPTIGSGICAVRSKGGGGIYNSGGVLTIKNTIISDNNSTNGTAPNCYGIINSLGHNLINDTQGANITTSSGDKLGVPAGLSSYSVDDVLLVDGLVSTSQAIDSGLCTSVYDIFSNPRPIGNGCDIGAIESPYSASASSSSSSSTSTSGGGGGGGYTYYTDPTPPSSSGTATSAPSEPINPDGTTTTPPEGITLDPSLTSGQDSSGAPSITFEKDNTTGDTQINIIFGPLPSSANPSSEGENKASVVLDKELLGSKDVNIKLTQTEDGDKALNLTFADGTKLQTTFNQTEGVSSKIEVVDPLSGQKIETTVQAPLGADLKFNKDGSQSLSIDKIDSSLADDKAVDAKATVNKDGSIDGVMRLIDKESGNVVETEIKAPPGASLNINKDGTQEFVKEVVSADGSKSKAKTEVNTDGVIANILAVEAINPATGQKELLVTNIELPANTKVEINKDGSVAKTIKTDNQEMKVQTKPTGASTFNLSDKTSGSTQSFETLPGANTIIKESGELIVEQKVSTPSGGSVNVIIEKSAQTKGEIAVVIVTPTGDKMQIGSYSEATNTKIEFISLDELFRGVRAKRATTKFDALASKFSSKRSFTVYARLSSSAQVDDNLTDANQSGSSGSYDRRNIKPKTRAELLATANTISISPTSSDAEFMEIQSFDKKRYIKLTKGSANIVSDGTTMAMKLNELYEIPSKEATLKNTPIYVNKRLQLQSGWNLISLPGDTNITTLLSSITSLQDSYSFDGSSWTKEPKELPKNRGIWVKVSKNEEVLSKSKSYELNISDIQKEGWHLLGSATDIDGSQLYANKNFKKVYLFSKGSWIENPSNIYRAQGFWLNNQNSRVYQNGKLELYRGWNLISLPVDTECQDVRAKIEGVNIYWQYKKSAWELNKYMLCKGEGAWLKLSSDTNASFEGSPYKLNIGTLEKGWNLVGVGEDTLLSDLKGSKTFVHMSYVFDNNIWIENPKMLYRGQGAWVKVE